MATLENAPKGHLDREGRSIYRSKRGNIVILTLDTFSEWRLSCELALHSADSWTVVDGTFEWPELGDDEIVTDEHIARQNNWLE